MSDFRVVIAGGGIAAIEGLLRLRRLAGDSVQITLLAPGEKLVLRPWAVRQPFAYGPPASYPLKEIAANAQAELVKDSLAWVDPSARVAHTESGGQIEFDALLVAVGARQIDPFANAGTFHDSQADETFRGIIQDIEGGYTKSIAFVLPEGPVYPLPLYELALLTAERASSMGVEDLEITLVTPESRPLAVFGETASEAVAGLLERAGITVYSTALAHVPSHRELHVQPPGVELHPDRIVTIPRVEGPAIRGLPGGGAHGFIPIDTTCAVPGTKGRVFAAGDSAAYPIKHGGLSAQMADSAAAAIAVLADADVEHKPFWPVIQGKLLSGEAPVYISARLVGAKGFQSKIHETPPWPEDDKVVADELGPYLAGLEPRRDTSTAPGPSPPSR
jgi:sulfide:quinone oxidoreductase